MPLRLRPLRLDDEPAFLAAHAAMAPGFTFGLNYEAGLDWGTYVTANARYRKGLDLPEGLVPAALLMADVDGAIVGRTSIRFELNDFLAREGGHIGYGVVPDHRRLGHATEILRQSLVIARSEGIDRVLVTCDDDNVGSATVIERCGGQLESRIESSHGVPIRRYWIP